MSPLPAAAVLIAIIATLLAVWYFLRKLERRNTVQKIDRGRIEWQEIRCARCNKAMEPGYAFAGKGLFWRARHDGEPGSFTMVGSALVNTLSFRLPQPVNQAWYCSDCKLLVLDNSRMLQIKKN